MLSPQQRDEFFALGFTRVSAAFTNQQSNALVDEFWNFLESHHRFRRDDPTTWTEGIVMKISELKRKAAFVDFDPAIVESVLDQLLEPMNWIRPASWHILATFPSADRAWSWDSLFQRQIEVKTVQWHTDYEYEMPAGRLSGVQIFALLADHEPGGGATMVMEGSPRVIETFAQQQPADVLQKMSRARTTLMQSHPFFETASQAVTTQTSEEWINQQRGEVEGASLVVRELTGKAGDVFFCHPWLLHAPSPNANDTPRLMCTQRIHRRVQSGR